MPDIDSREVIVPEKYVDYLKEKADAVNRNEMDAVSFFFAVDRVINLMSRMKKNV